MSKKTTVLESTIMDADGVVRTSRTITKKVLNTEHFVKTYIEDIGMLAKCSGAEQSTVLASLKYLDHNTNEILISASRRLEICEIGNLKLNTVNVAIARLVKKGIFIKKSSSTYILNPKIFFKGDDLARLEVFSLIIEYQIGE